MLKLKVNQQETQYLVRLVVYIEHCNQPW